MNELETRLLRDDIINGLNFSFQKLVTEKKKTNSEMVFSHNGDVIKVKATDI